MVRKKKNFEGEKGRQDGIRWERLLPKQKNSSQLDRNRSCKAQLNKDKKQTGWRGNCGGRALVPRSNTRCKRLLVVLQYQNEESNHSS